MSHGGRRKGSGRKAGPWKRVPGGVPDYPKKPLAASPFSLEGWAKELKRKKVVTAKGGAGVEIKLEV